MTLEASWKDINMSTAQSGITPQRQFENRINFNFTSMSTLSADMKEIYTEIRGYKFLLVITDEVTNSVKIPLF